MALALVVEIVRSASTNKDPRRTQWLMDRGLQIAKDSGDAYALACTAGAVGVGRYLEGGFAEALRFLRESQRIHRERLNATSAWDMVTMIFFEMRALSQIGRVHELIERVPDMLRDAEERGDLYASTIFRISRLSWAWIGLDKPELAKAQIEMAERQWKQEPYQLVHYYTLQAAGELALYQGRPEDVWERLASEHRQMKLVTKIQVTRVEQFYLRGRMALALASKNGDPGLVREAQRCARALQKERAPWAHALGRLIAGCAAQKASAAAAANLLEALPEQFEALDMLLPAAVTRYRLGQLKGGAEGGTLVAGARDAMVALGAKNPEGFVQMLAPEI